MVANSKNEYHQKNKSSKNEKCYIARLGLILSKIPHTYTQTFFIKPCPCNIPLYLEFTILIIDNIKILILILI